MTFLPPTAADRRVLLWIVLTVFVLKLAVVSLIVPHFEASLSPTYGLNRGDLYDRLAKSLLRGDGYRFMPDTAPTLLREPGYPLFLAAISWTTGYSAALVRIANLILSSLSALMIGALAWRVSAKRMVYFLAPLLFMLHPGVVIAEIRVAVEIIFIFLLLCFFVTLSRALRTGSFREYLFAGAVLGVASSVRSTELLLPLLLPLCYLLWNRSASGPKHLVSGIAALYCGCFLILTPWIIRNYSLVGEFVPTASVLGTSMHSGYYMCTHGDSGKTTAELDLDGASVRSQMAEEQGYRIQRRYYQIFYDSRDEVAFNHYLTRWVLGQYEKAPAVFFKCATQNVFNFWFRGKNRTVTLANIVVQLPYLVLGLIGIALGARRADPLVLGPLVLFLVYGFAIYLPILAQARYSIPLVPVLAICSALTLSEFAHRVRAGPDTR